MISKIAGQTDIKRIAQEKSNTQSLKIAAEKTKKVISKSNIEQQTNNYGQQPRDNSLWQEALQKAIKNLNKSIKE